MFAILVPVSLAPLIITLLWAERKARKLGVIARSKHADENSSESYARRILKAAEKLDLLGLLLIGTSVALILLPLTLSQSAKGGWRNGMLHSQLFISIILVAEPCFRSFYDCYDRRRGCPYSCLRSLGLQVRKISRHCPTLRIQPERGHCFRDRRGGLRMSSLPYINSALICVLIGLLLYLLHLPLFFRPRCEAMVRIALSVSSPLSSKSYFPQGPY